MFHHNQVRSFMSLNWDIFGKELAEVMSFKSLNAQRYAKACSDHHKAWELLRTFYLGTLDELLTPYVKHCKATGQIPTADGYLTWKDAVATNPTYLYMFEQVTVYCQAIMNMRAGLRRNNIQLVNSARITHAPLFHGRNHPKYQSIELAETIRNVRQPPEVSNFMDKIQSFSDKGPSRGEDFDFKVEIINHLSKTWIPRGVPSNDDWLRIFRNLEPLEKVCMIVSGGGVRYNI